MDLVLKTFLYFHVLVSVVYGSILREKMTVLQDPNDEADRKVVVVSWRNDYGDGFQCQMYTDQKLIQEVLKTSGDEPVRRPTKEEMAFIREECDSFSDMTRRRRQVEDSEGSSEAASSWNVIFPGTKWCGNGDTASNDDDLGSHADTDRCCRAHDKCDDIVLAGETKHNLTNKSPFTKLSCKCDDVFYDCLSEVNSLPSNTVGNTYFNLLRRECFKNDYPLGNKCLKHTSPLKITCLEYERDYSSPPVYQWVSAKIFKNLPVPGPLDIKLRISDEKMDMLRQILP
ncbi:hypothetical protein JTE90_028698 [Oedothorax gibbosus]|uniref:Phospholipase A2 n=1 Tax=Oedothorax gibbosus TaxID=931172 RepID=A0AAV6U0B9_9ARAC|nr:hypothetical protein JTE90_028698 [Oedothorax gibbosus]